MAKDGCWSIILTLQVVKNKVRLFIKQSFIPCPECILSYKHDILHRLSHIYYLLFWKLRRMKRNLTIKLTEESMPPPHMRSLCTMQCELSPGALPDVNVFKSHSSPLSGTTVAALWVFSITRLLSWPQPARKLLPNTSAVFATHRADIRPILDLDNGNTSPWCFNARIFGWTMGGWIQGPVVNWAEGLISWTSSEPTTKLIPYSPFSYNR